jgi:hypothetical protein
VRPVPDVHAGDQAVIDRVDVLDVLIGDHAAVEVADELVDIDDGAVPIVFVERLGFDVRVDGLELPRPVPADLVVAVQASAVDRVGPVDVGLEACKRGIDVSLVEGGIEAADVLVMG